MPPQLEEVIATQLVEARRLANHSQASLAEELQSFGEKIHATTVAKVEQGDRQLKAVELVRWATALDVRPSVILCPLDPNEEIEVFPGWPAKSRTVRQFVEGRYPLSAWPHRPVEPAYFSRVSDDVANGNRYPMMATVTGLGEALQTALWGNNETKVEEILEMIIKQCELALSSYKVGLQAYPGADA